MKRKGLILGVVMCSFLLIMPLVIAESTEVKIKTIPYAEVQIVIYDADIQEFTLTERYTGNSDQYGDINHDFEIVDDTFHLKVFVKKDGESLISNEKFLDNPSGGIVYLEAPYNSVELIPTPGFEKGVAIIEVIEELNETINTTEIETEDLEEEDSKTIGTMFSIFGEDGILSKRNFYYIGGFLFLMVIAGFVVAKIKHKRNLIPKDIKIKKLSELQKEKEEKLEDKGEKLSELRKERKQDLDEKKEDVKDYTKIIEDAEKKILEAQQDIKKIKNEEKIKDMRKKIAEDEAELIKLREGRD